MLPNFYPDNWFECDMFALNSNKFFHEYEIKLTVADFNNDFKKIDGRQRHPPKHNRLASGDTFGPKYFSFVVPTEIVNKVKIPEYAGLITIKNNCLYHAKKARRLHNRQVSDKVVYQIIMSSTSRYWNYKLAQKTP